LGLAAPALLGLPPPPVLAPPLLAPPLLVSAETYTRVIRGLDPRIHHLREKSLSKKMDGRVKPGHDEKNQIGRQRPARQAKP
jgi:hypothetical protein